MAVAIVITSVTIKPDGFVYVVGTVAAVATTCAVLLTNVIAIPLANIQTFLALQLAAASAQQIVVASLAGTVNL